VTGAAAAFAASMIVLGLGAAASLAAPRAAVLAAIAASTLATLLASGGPVCAPWLGSIPLCVGIDSVSKLFALLSGVVAVSVLAYAEGAGLKGGGGTAALRLVVVGLHAAVLGLVYSFSLPAFYIFWEMVLAASAAMIWLWEPRRAVEFFIYMHAGSLLLLVSIAILVASGAAVFGASVATGLAGLALTAALTAFAIKLGVFPFHTWIPRAYTAVPPAIAGILAGVVTSIGAYGMYRLVASLAWPQAATSILNAAVWLGAVSALIGALRALSANRLGLIASYSSVGHAGMIYAGLAAASPAALAGGVLAAIAHGLVKALFFLVAGVLEKQAGTDDISRMGLFAYRMPLTAFAGFTAAMSLAGLPPFALFPGELLVVLGVGHTRGAGAAAMLALAVLASTAYALRFWRRVFWHPATAAPRPPPPEPRASLLAPLLLLAIASIALGVAPVLIVDAIG